MNTFPIKYVEANKAFEQFKVLGNQINKNISITRVFLRLNHLDGTPLKYLTVLDTLKWDPWAIWDLANFYNQQNINKSNLSKIQATLDFCSGERPNIFGLGAKYYSNETV